MAVRDKIFEVFEEIRENNKEYEEGLREITKGLDALGIEDWYVGNHIIFYLRSMAELKKIAKITYQEIKGDLGNKYISFLINDNLKISFKFTGDIY